MSRDLLFQNVRGLNEDKLEELVLRLTRANLGAAVMAETWKALDSDLTSVLVNDGHHLILNGNSAMEGKATRGGVGILLSPKWTSAWKEAGSQVLRFGARVLAVRLEIPCAANKTEKIFLVGAYAPTTASSEDESETFYTELENCVNECKNNELLLIGADLNAALGTAGEEDDDGVRGKHGIPHENKRGRELRGFLASHQLCSPTSFFEKSSHATWQHFRSHKHYQNDFWIVKRKHLRRIRDAGVQPGLAVHSDHLPLRLRLLSPRKYKRARKTAEPKKKRGCRRMLQVEDAKQAYIAVFNKEMSKIVNDGKSSNTRLTEAILTAASSELQGENKHDPSWFRVSEKKIAPLIQERNEMVANGSRLSGVKEKRLERTKRKLRKEIAKAKESWLRKVAKRIQEGPQKGTGGYWKSVTEMKLGHNRTRRETSYSFKKSDGQKCTTNEESVQVVKEAFKKNLNIVRPFDDSLLEHLIQSVLPAKLTELLDADPTAEEVKAALRRAAKGKAAGDTGVPIEFYQALADDEEAFEHVLDVIVRSWKGEDYDEWTLSKLKILPKKGDLSDPNNWRPIMLLEVLQKTMSSMFTQRFAQLLDYLGLAEQFGFQKSMGTPDGSFVVRQSINVRHEAGKDTYVLFVDLVKAFDSVPRDGMIKVLKKFGVPSKMLSWIERIYDKVEVKVEIEGASDTFASCTGVKQGDNLSPTLFLFMMQAFMELVRNKNATGQDWPKRLTFRTRKDGILTGRQRNAGGKNSEKLREPTAFRGKGGNKGLPTVPGVYEFELDASLYADDAGMMFGTKEELTRATNIVFTLLKRMGLMMHVGRGVKASKTEAMFIPGFGREYEDGDTSRYSVDGDGFIDFTKTFPYLGSKISSDCTDDADIDNRIAQASKMFGCLRKKVLCSKRVSNETKRQLYEAYVLSILLFGCEFWRLNAASLGRLEKFHRRSVRAMAGTTTYMTWQHRISAFELEKRFGLRGIESYIAERALRWLGHVVRMDRDKLPRQILTAWVYQEKSGDSNLGMRRTYGASMIQYHFAYLIKNPSLHPATREALTREVEHRSIESGKDFPYNKLKTQTYYADEGNWVRLAENRDFWKKEVVEKVKFHYNYRYPEPIVEVELEPEPEKCKWDLWAADNEVDPRMCKCSRCKLKKKKSSSSSTSKSSSSTSKSSSSTSKSSSSTSKSSSSRSKSPSKSKEEDPRR